MAARDEVYAADLSSMGGVIEEIGVWLATKLGEKGRKSEINNKNKKAVIFFDQMKYGG